MSGPYLQMQHITKAFPGVKALDDVHLDVHLGEVHALLGENGAGKSTLMKVLSGVYQPDAGEIILDGKPMSFLSTREAEKAGIAIIYQELNLIPQMTVAENIYLGREPRNKLGLVNFAKMRAGALAELQQLDANISPNARISQIRVGEQQLVEIAKALSLRAKIVIMDEPTSALSETEAQKLFQVIHRLRQSGVAILYITHKLEEIFAIAQKVTVLRDGRHIGTIDVQATDSTSLIGMMVGRELRELYPKQQAPIGEELLRVEGLTIGHPTQGKRTLLRDIQFNLRAGEILGIAGLMGAGRTELLMTLFGAPPAPVVGGRLFLKNQLMNIKTPTEAIQHGLALVTEDRKLHGLFLTLSVQMNVSIASLKQAVRFWLLRRRTEKNMVESYVQQLRIKSPSLAAAVETLSGGNQQKVILAKWLLTKPKILLLDDPTRGIDVGAKAEIYQLMNQFAAQGMGIVLVSSELPELLAMSDRILVLNQGRLTGEFSREEATEHKIMEAATKAISKAERKEI